MRTRIVPATLDQNLRVFLKPADYWREIQLVLPDSPTCYITTEGDAEEFGYNRPYKLAPMAAGAQLIFPLAPGQELAGQVKDGMAVIGLIESPCNAPSGK